MNQRAHIRQNVDMPVRLRAEATGEIAARIGDFCLGGLLVHLDDEQSRFLAAFREGDTLDVVATVQGFRGERDISLTARIARVEEAGLGLRFESPDTTALLALQNHVRSLRDSAAEPGQSAASTAATQKKHSAEHIAKAVSALRMMVEAVLHECMEAFFPAAEAALLDAADQAGSNQAQHPYFEAGKLLARGARPLQQNFIAGVCQNIDAMAQGRELDAADAAAEQGGGLSLVDKEEFEDWLALKVMATRAEGRFNEDILHLQLRLDDLFQITLSARRNPLHPAFICRAFGESLRLIPLKSKTDRVVLAAFEAEVINKLDTLYRQSNALLAEEGVLRDLDVARYIAERFGQQPETRAAPVPEATEQASGGEPESEQGQDAPAQSSDAALASDRHPDTEAPADRAPVALAAVKPAVAESGSQRFSGSAGQSLAARQFALQQHIAKHAYETVRNLLSVKGVEAAQANVSAPPEGVPVVAAPAARESLAQLQRQPQALDDSTSLAERVQLAVAGEHGGNAALDQELQVAVDLIHHLFEGIIGNPALSDRVRKALKRLEVPFLRLLIDDDSFLQHEEHPARQVLNRMARLGVRGSANLAAHEQEIEQKAHLINEEFDSDINVFQDVLQRLDELSDRQESLYVRNLKRVQEACEGKQKLIEARREVGKALERRIGGRKVPRAVLGLIDVGWRQLLVQTLLRDGRDSKTWHEYLGVIDRLIKAGETVPEQSGLAGLLTSIKQGLGRVDETQVHNARLVTELRDLLSAKVRQHSTPVMVDVPAGMVDPEAADSDENADEMTQRWQRRARRHEPGDWFEHSADGKKELLKLAWADPGRNTFVFVNHQGMQVMEYSLADFADRLKNRQFEPVDDQAAPAVDRGLERMVQRVYDQMAHQATHDDLSGLLNRREFERRLRQLLTESVDAPGSFLHLDVDQFKLVNNTGGPEAGDELIRQMSRLLEEMFPSALLARTGGDEFAVWLQGVPADAARKAAESLCGRVSEMRFDCLGKSYMVTLSGGLVHRAPGLQLANDLIRAADSACHAAKESGRNRLQVYASDDREMARRDDVMSWVTRLNEALDADRLRLRCQRIEPTGGGGLPAYEVLISVASEDGELLAPAEFLKAAEQYNRMHAIDRWVISNVMRWMHSNPEVLAGIDHLSINLSGHSMNDASLPEFLFEHFQRYPVPKERICFEVTETAAIANLEDAADFIRELQDMGCRFSLDDFGSGLASYGHLKHLPVDYIKIDGTFIRDIASDNADLALVRSINEMGHLMGKRTIAEYVENDDIRQLLADIGVDFVQGYGVEKPRPLDSLSAS